METQGCINLRQLIWGDVQVNAESQVLRDQPHFSEVFESAFWTCISIPGTTKNILTQNPHFLLWTCTQNKTKGCCKKVGSLLVLRTLPHIHAYVYVQNWCIVVALVVDVFQWELGLVGDCAEGILKAILKVLCIMYHHHLTRLYASRMTRVTQLQQTVFGVFKAVGLLSHIPTLVILSTEGTREKPLREKLQIIHWMTACHQIKKESMKSRSCLSSPARLPSDADSPRFTICAAASLSLRDN